MLKNVNINKNANKKDTKANFIVKLIDQCHCNQIELRHVTKEDQKKDRQSIDISFFEGQSFHHDRSIFFLCY